MTCAVKRQLLLAATEPPEKESVPVPVPVGVPPQEFAEMLSSSAPLSMAERSSVKSMLDAGEVLEFSISNSRATVPPDATGSFVNDFDRIKALEFTEKVAVNGSITVATPAIDVEIELVVVR